MPCDRLALIDDLALLVEQRKNIRGLLHEGAEAFLTFAHSPLRAHMIRHVSRYAQDRRGRTVIGYAAVTNLQSSPGAVSNKHISTKWGGQLSLTTLSPPCLYDCRLLRNEQLEDIHAEEFVSVISRGSLSSSVYPSEVSVPIMRVHDVAGVLKHVEKRSRGRRQRNVRS